MSFIANILASIGMTFADCGTVTCIMLIADEPNMPESLLEK